MRSNSYSDYSEKIGLAICDQEPASGWTLIGHGAISFSEKQPSAFNIGAIIAPFGGKNQLPKSIEVPLPIGAIEILQLRRSWFQNELRDEYKRSNNVEVRQVSLNTGEFEIKRLGDIWQRDISGGALDSLRRSTYLKYKAKFKGKEINFYVPSAEVFRFYYSPSSNFVNAALSSEKADVCLYNPINRESTSQRAIELGVPCVTLRKSIEDSTAAYVSRIALSDYAENCFNRISNDTIRTPKYNANMNLICRPPLNQTTNWLVDGIAHGDGFFVTQIRSCYGSFPFSRVLYDRDNNTSGKRTKPPEKVLKIEYGKPLISEGDGKPTAVISDTPEPSVYVEPLILEVIDGDPLFPGLDDSKVVKVLKALLLDETKQTIRVFSSNEVVQYLTTAVASGELNKQNIGQLNIKKVSKKDGHALAIYDVMPELATLLEGNDENYVSLYFLRGQKHPHFPEATIVPYHSYDRKDLCFINESDEVEYFRSNRNIAHLRPMALFRIVFQDKSYYALEFLSADGFTPDKISGLMFSELIKPKSDELVENEIKKFDLFGRKWRTKTIDKLPPPSSKFAHKFRHDPKSRAETKALQIYKLLEKSNKK